MSTVRLEGLAKTYPGGVTAVGGVDLQIADGEFMVLVGPSGCGKTTTLRMIAGLEDASAGRIEIGGRDVTELPPAQRGVAMVFQSYALYPHLTVRENMGFALKMAGRPRDEVAAAVQRAADVLQLGALLDRKPRQLSGGQRQRVAIGRAIVRKPEVFLFDEPLSNLDAALRTQMRVELSRLHAELGATMVYVTHDQVEAMTLGDRIAIFDGGRIRQVGAPLDLYHRPVSRFVAGFLGSPRMNFLPARVVASMADGARAAVQIAGASTLGLARPLQCAAGEVATLGVRPEHLSIADEAAPGALAARIELVEQLGDSTIVHCSAPGVDEPLAVKLPAGAGAGLARGAAVRLQPDAARVLLFDEEGRTVHFPGAE